MKRFSTIIILLSCFCHAFPQEWMDYGDAGKLEWLKGIQYEVEAQGSISHGKTPLWLNANKYGLSSLEECNVYLRGAVTRPIGMDSIRRWGLGYGIDLALPYHYTSDIIVQQAYAQVRWLHGTLTIGSKHYPLEMKNDDLSSGSQTLGINARPVPQVRLALPDYWTLPFSNGWLSVKGHVAYGRMTDDHWQHDFTQRKSKYADNVRYHSKAGFIKIGNEEGFYPLSLELGLEMACTFGGTSYAPMGSDSVRIVKGNARLKDYYRAFIPGSSESIEKGTPYENAEGNQLGSWVMRLKYDDDDWCMSIYADRYFEDHSSMLSLDYDGYGTGEEWNEKKRSRFQLYSFKDWMLGTELNFKYNHWLRNIVFEYLYTKYQSGPIYHDHSEGMTNHIGGNDNFYNHYIYTGWQHWGQVIGNPLYLSPIYNEGGDIYVHNNRFMAFHLGFDGNPTERLHYRSLVTWQDGLGTYSDPYTKNRHSLSVLVEADYRLARGWKVKGAWGMDAGNIRGNNQGWQITISKSGTFK